MCFQPTHFHRWFEDELHHNVGIIWSCVIDCMKEQAIREETTSVSLFFCLAKLLYLDALSDKAFYLPYSWFF